jgi:ATP-dependent Zn protease
MSRRANTMNTFVKLIATLTRARKIITENRAVLEKLANLLQEKEVINREEMTTLLAVN